MMDTTRQLTGLDRWTLRLWRITNILGWSLVALVTAFFFRLGVEAAAGFLHRSLADSTVARDYGLFAVRVEVPASLLCGGAIGTMLGARVYRRPQIAAGIVSVLYAAGVLLQELSYPATRGERTIVAAAVLVVVPISLWFARRTSRNRPRALRR